MLDRRHFLGCAAAALPGGSMLRFVQGSKLLPSGKGFSLYRNGTPADEINLALFGDAMASFNSRHWRGERPMSVQLASFSWERRPNGSFDVRFNFVRKPMPRIMMLVEKRWIEVPWQLYRALDFNEFDLGKPAA